MTSSTSSSEEEDAGFQSSLSHTRNRAEVTRRLKKKLQLSIIARRYARGQKQIKIEYNQPKSMELTPAEMERKERRREQNRLAAQRCRKKKRVNQYSVIQSFEKVIEQNESLRQEVEALKQERDRLRKQIQSHRVTCSCFKDMKVDDRDQSSSIKLEPLDIDDDDEEPLSLEALEKPSLNSCSETTQRLSQHFSCDPRFPSQSCACPSEQLSINNVQSIASQQQPLFGHTEQTQRQPFPWRYSPSFDPEQRHRRTSPCSPSPKTRGELHQSHGFVDQTEGHESEQQQESYLERYSIPTSVTSTSISDQAQYRELVRLLQSPSSHSPSSSSSLPFYGCLQEKTRQRSFSGESSGALDSSRSGLEMRGSSVSSEGSLFAYQERRTLEVPDIDSDDVFSGAVSDDRGTVYGNDLNNNNNTAVNNNIAAPLSISSAFLFQGQNDQQLAPASEGWQEANMDSTENRPHNDMTRSGSLTGDDFSSIMQIPNNDLLFFTVENEPSSDILSDYMRDSSDD